MWSYRLLSTRENSMIACFQFPAVRVYVCGSKEYLYFQGVFLSEILVSVRIPLYSCRLDTCRSYVSAERVKSNKRWTVCLHTLKSTHLQVYCLRTLFSFSPQDLLVSRYLAEQLSHAFPPVLYEVCSVSEKGELL